MIFKNILFVCVGNICRSPMAMGYFRDQLKDFSNVKIHSAGLSAVVGEFADQEAQAVMQEVGIDISGHVARQLTNEMLRDADLILVMEKWHKKDVERLMPTARGKVYLLGQWSNSEVPDPYFQSRENFVECLGIIKKSWYDWKKIMMNS